MSPLLSHPGVPEPLSGCTISNSSITSFEVRCQPGLDGGLPQTFVLEVRDRNTQQVSQAWACWFSDISSNTSSTVHTCVTCAPANRQSGHIGQASLCVILQEIPGSALQATAGRECTGGNDLAPNCYHFNTNDPSGDSRRSRGAIQEGNIGTESVTVSRHAWMPSTEE